MPPVTGSSLKAQQLRFWDQLISRSWELQSSVRPKTDPDKPHYISASAGRPGIRYGYSISRNGAFVQLSIDTDNKLRNEAMFDRLAAKEDEVKRDFGRPGLDFQRRDDQIGSYVVYKLGETWTPYDESSWPEIRDRLIEAMDLLYQAIQRHVRELID
jgi:hypothetical protein